MHTSLLQLGHKILNSGHWEFNERTGKKCLTIPIHVAEYYPEYPPIDTTRKQAFKAPIAELLGYFRGYTNAEQFAAIGSPTWFANANETQAWLANPNRSGENDCGLIYGAVAQDEFLKVYNNLKNGIDDRGEIITFWKPETFDRACLRPCMHTHSFQLVDGTLHLTSTQRSADVPMAGSWNSLQAWILLKLMAQITDNKCGKVTHIIERAHIYEDQYDLFVEQMERPPMHVPNLEVIINPKIRTLDDVMTWVTTDDFTLKGYHSHDAIKFPFSA